MMTRKPCALTFAALYSTTATASYHDGDLGSFIAIVSVPIAGCILAVALLMTLFGLFKHRGVFLSYVVSASVFALAGLLFSSGSEAASVGIVALAESVLLLIVVLPAVLQRYWGRWKRAD